MTATAAPAHRAFHPPAQHHAADFVQYWADHHPTLTTLLDPQRLALAASQQWTTEFDSDTAGRGDSYRTAQQELDARSIGIAQLLAATGPATTVLDVFGGDGLIARWCRRHGQPVDILTADVSPPMVRAAHRHGLPAVQQPAQQMVLRDASIEAVLMAYGTHHLAVDDRGPAFAEAHRVLAPGGRLVVHDFATGSPMTHWFADVVDHHAPGGHPYQHFTADGLHTHLRQAGFQRITIASIYDPICIRRPDATTAATALAAHLIHMYGLTGPAADPRWVLRRCRDVFRYDRSRPAGARRRLTMWAGPTGFHAELPRVALMASATKT